MQGQQCLDRTTEALAGSAQDPLASADVQDAAWHPFATGGVRAEGATLP